LQAGCQTAGSEAFGAALLQHKWRTSHWRGFGLIVQALFWHEGPMCLSRRAPEDREADVSNQGGGESLRIILIMRLAWSHARLHRSPYQVRGPCCGCRRRQRQFHTGGCGLLGRSGHGRATKGTWPPGAWWPRSASVDGEGWAGQPAAQSSGGGLYSAAISRAAVWAVLDAKNWSVPGTCAVAVARGWCSMCPAGYHFVGEFHRRQW